MKQFVTCDEFGCLVLNGKGYCKFCKRNFLKEKDCATITLREENNFIKRQKKLTLLLNNEIKNQTNIVLNLKGVNNG